MHDSYYRGPFKFIPIWSQMLIDRYQVQKCCYCKQFDALCQILEKFNTPECILQGSIYFSVYHNFSVVLITDNIILLSYYWYWHNHPKCSTQLCSSRTQKTFQKSQWHMKVYATKSTFNPHHKRVIWTPGALNSKVSTRSKISHFCYKKSEYNVLSIFPYLCPYI